jgi:SAM-dependent methyltransferase
MSVLRDTAKRLLQFPADALVISSKKISEKTQKYFPYPAADSFYLLQKQDHKGPNGTTTGLPLPPQYLRLGYGSVDEHWLNAAKADVDGMMSVVNSENFHLQTGNRVLDFGCGAGRTIRCLASLAEECEIWGVDISARHIVWCQENLNPPFNFATVTTQPHLPFEDRYFDFIYCFSVFTHIDDLADSWLLELKRIMRPGGRAYITVHDKHTQDLIINHIDRVPYADEFRQQLLSYAPKMNLRESDYYMFSINSPGGPQANVFYDIDHLRQHWGRIFNIISITPEAHGYQTAIVVEK